MEVVPAGLTMPRRHGRAGVLALLILVALALRAGATTVVAKSFTDLCREADLVFVGTVSGVESRWIDAAKQSMETRVTFTDLSWLRGAPRGAITLSFAGGELDGLREEIAGMPHFAVGERVVIFARDGTFVSPIVGFSQGLYRVVDGADGPQVVGAGGPAVADAPSAALRQGTAGAAAAGAVPLEQFLDQVRAGLAAGVGQGTP